MVTTIFPEHMTNREIDKKKRSSEMKKSAASILIIALAAGLIIGCKDNRVAGSLDSTVSQEVQTETRIITDSLGREVKIPVVVEKIVPLGNTPRMITYLGLADKVSGIGGMDPEKISPVTAYAFANKKLWSKVPIVGTDAGGATNYYPEQIISVDPDVIFCSYNRELADEIQNKTGVPVVAVPMGTLFGKNYEEALLLLGNVCGVVDRAQDVIAYINNALKDLRERTAAVPDADKPTVLGAAATFKGAHGIEGVYSKYAVFQAIAANDVTDGIAEKSGGILVDREQILGWNPQVIFLDSGGVNLVKMDFDKNPGFYTQLKAVTHNMVYQYPSSTSYYSNVEIPIVNSYYVGSILYPEQFTDIDFSQKADEIFRFFLGVDHYLKNLEAADFGYCNVILGDN